jgi:rubredoxin
MNTNDGIKIKKRTDGRFEDVTETEFRQVLQNMLELAAASGEFSPHLATRLTDVGNLIRDTDAHQSWLGTFEHACFELEAADHDTEVPHHFACPTCGERSMDALDATIEGQYTCATCNTVYADDATPDQNQPSWKDLPGGITLYAARGRWVTVPGAISPAVRS